MTRLMNRITVVAIAAGICAAGGLMLFAQDARTTRIADAAGTAWSLDAIWDDGKAEVAVYDGERVIYGASRAHTLHLITVKEDFNREYNVKADWPYGEKPIRTVLKQNQVATIPTPNYPYHFMTSVFVDRADATKLVKMTVSSQEWCGVTSKEFDFSGRTPRWTWSSYWDGEGSGNGVLRGWPSESVFEEQLPMLVRTLELRDGLELGLALAPNQITNKAPRPEPVAARLRVERPDGVVQVAAGTWEAANAWRVIVEAADGRALEFVVAEEAPHVLIAWSGNDGRFYELREVTRDAYWQIRD